MLRYLKNLDWRDLIASAFVLGCLFAIVSPSSIQPPYKPTISDPKETVGNTCSEDEKAKSFWQRTACDPLNLYTGFLALFTFALVGISGCQIFFLIRADKTARTSAIAARDAANIAERTLIASQRPWIQVEVFLSTPLVFDARGANTMVSFKIKSIGGNIPAINITPHAWMVVGRRNLQMPIQEQINQCNAIKRQPFTPLGHTLFPGESFPESLGWGQWNHGVSVGRAEIDDAAQEDPINKSIMLYVFGCVDYTFPTDPSNHHQTGFFREVRKKVPAAFISPVEGAINHTDLALVTSILGTGRFAD